MDEQLRDLFEACLEQATDDDRKVLHTLLAGVKKKQDNINSSYIGGILHMDRTITAQECRITMPVSPSCIIHSALCMAGSRPLLSIQQWAPLPTPFCLRDTGQSPHS